MGSKGSWGKVAYVYSTTGGRRKGGKDDSCNVHTMFLSKNRTVSESGATNNSGARPPLKRVVT